MDEIESQVAKIQIGNPKVANAYVLTVAEKAGGSNAELFIVAELPILNPAALESCEKICLAIAAALRRSYKKSLTAVSFENAIAQINDELGKLASLGQTHWIDKLNCIIAVKENTVFHITTCGKVAAFLYRDSQFTDISSSPEHSHPLKTFENLATGKIRLGDLVLLSTAQMFNYLAIERLKDISSKNTFLGASQTLLEILKENAGPGVAFGAILNLQVAPGATASGEIDLEEYTAGMASPASVLIVKIKEFLSSLFLKPRSRKPQVDLPKISVSPEIKQAAGNIPIASEKKFLPRFSFQAIKTAAARWLDTALAWLSWTVRKANPQKIKNFSPEKKLFLLSMIILLASAIASIGVAKKVSQRKADSQKIQVRLTEVGTLLDKASNSLLYRNDLDAKEYLTEAASKLPSFADVPEDSQNKYRELEKNITELKGKMDRTTEAKVDSMGNLGNADFLIKLPKYLAIQVNGNLVSFNKTNSLFQDGLLKIPEILAQSVATAGSQAAAYTGSSLIMWNFDEGTVGPAFTSNVPAKEDFAGIAWYPTSSRLYAVDKNAGKIYSYAVSGSAISRPTVWSKNANDLRSAQDIAIDGSVYILTANGITKYFGGNLAEFNFPQLFQRFSGRGKIYTDKDTRNIYILDGGNNRIIILDKKGSLISSLVAKQFTQLKDFQVDEKNKTIWALNGTQLLRVTIP